MSKSHAEGVCTVVENTGVPTVCDSHGMANMKLLCLTDDPFLSLFYLFFPSLHYTHISLSFSFLLLLLDTGSFN